MLLPRFQLLQPKSIEQATELLGKHEAAARIMAGGTDVLPRMKYGLESPGYVIGLSNLPVFEPVDSDGFLLLDSLMSLTDVARSEIIRQNAFGLAEAAYAVGSYQIRNMGTLGGNLCLETRCMYYNQQHSYQFVEPCFKRNGDRCYFIPKGKQCWAVFVADTAPVLFSLDASVEVLSNGSPKRIPIDEFYTCGFPINPLLVEGQIDGQASMALGHAFTPFTPEKILKGLAKQQASRTPNHIQPHT